MCNYFYYIINFEYKQLQIIEEKRQKCSKISGFCGIILTMIIAEIGTSHGGNLDHAFSLIKGAKESGADIVKFQWVYADEILHPKTGFVELPTGKIPLYERFKQLEVDPSFFKKCSDYCKSLGLEFLCSPFGLRSLKELLDLKPSSIKIASPELNHFPLLKAVAEYRRSEEGKQLKVILSSGVSKIEDIEAALEILKDGNSENLKNVVLLHCVTSYPAPVEDYNLKLLDFYREKFGIETGISDHSLDPVIVPVFSLVCGGTYIEKHITLSKETDGLDDPVALDLEQFSYMSHAVHQTEAMMRQYPDWKEKTVLQMEDSFGRETVEKVLGNGKKVLAESEKNNYGRTNRSLHFMRDMKKGEVIGEGDIAVLRTEKILTVGEHPKYLEAFTGKKLLRDVSDGEGVLFEFVE